MSKSPTVAYEVKYFRTGDRLLEIETRPVGADAEFEFMPGSLIAEGSVRITNRAVKKFLKPRLEKHLGGRVRGLKIGDDEALVTVQAAYPNPRTYEIKEEKSKCSKLHAA